MQIAISTITLILQSNFSLPTYKILRLKIKIKTTNEGDNTPIYTKAMITTHKCKSTIPSFDPHISQPMVTHNPILHDLLHEVHDLLHEVHDLLHEVHDLLKFEFEHRVAHKGA